jgi:uncharacterized protein (DUF433 family)
VAVAQEPEAVPVAAHAQPEPPDPWLEEGGIFAFALDGCGPIRGVDGAVVLEAAAEALGLSPEALRDELEAGRSLGEVAEAQGVSRQALTEAIKAAAVEAYRARLDAAVADGRLTQERADERMERFQAQDFAAWLERPYFLLVPHFELAPFGAELPFDLPADIFRDHPEGFHFSFSFGTGGEPFVFSFGSDSAGFRAAAAGALGLTPDELAARLDAGESLAEIAAAQDVPLEDVEAAVRDALLAEARERLNAAVADGSLTQEQADKILGELGDGIRLESFRDPRSLPWPERLPLPFFEDEEVPSWLQEALPERGTD